MPRPETIKRAFTRPIYQVMRMFPNPVITAAFQAIILFLTDIFNSLDHAIQRRNIIIKRENLRSQKPEENEQKHKPNSQPTFHALRCLPRKTQHDQHHTVRNNARLRQRQRLNIRNHNKQKEIKPAKLLIAFQKENHRPHTYAPI